MWTKQKESRVLAVVQTHPFAKNAKGWGTLSLVRDGKEEKVGHTSPGLSCCFSLSVPIETEGAAFPRPCSAQALCVDRGSAFCARRREGSAKGRAAPCVTRLSCY